MEILVTLHTENGDDVTTTFTEITRHQAIDLISNYAAEMKNFTVKHVYANRKIDPFTFKLHPDYMLDHIVFNASQAIVPLFVDIKWSLDELGGGTQNYEAQYSIEELDRNIANGKWIVLN